MGRPLLRGLAILCAVSMLSMIIVDRFNRVNELQSKHSNSQLSDFSQALKDARKQEAVFSGAWNNVPAMEKAAKDLEMAASLEQSAFKMEHSHKTEHDPKILSPGPKIPVKAYSAADSTSWLATVPPTNRKRFFLTSNEARNELNSYFDDQLSQQRADEAAAGHAVLLEPTREKPALAAAQDSPLADAAAAAVKAASAEMSPMAVQSHLEQQVIKSLAPALERLTQRAAKAEAEASKAREELREARAARAAEEANAAAPAPAASSDSTRAAVMETMEKQVVKSMGPAMEALSKKAEKAEEKALEARQEADAARDHEASLRSQLAQARAQAAAAAAAATAATAAAVRREEAPAIAPMEAVAPVARARPAVAAQGVLSPSRGVFYNPKRSGVVRALGVPQATTSEAARLPGVNLDAWVDPRVIKRRAATSPRAAEVPGYMGEGGRQLASFALPPADEPTCPPCGFLADCSPNPLSVGYNRPTASKSFYPAFGQTAPPFHAAGLVPALPEAPPDAAADKATVSSLAQQPPAAAAKAPRKQAARRVSMGGVSQGIPLWSRLGSIFSDLAGVGGQTAPAASQSGSRRLLWSQAAGEGGGAPQQQLASFFLPEEEEEEEEPGEMEEEEAAPPPPAEPEESGPCGCPVCKLGAELVGPDDELVGKVPVEDPKLLSLVDNELRKIDPNYAQYRMEEAVPISHMTVPRATGAANPWSDFADESGPYTNQVATKTDTVWKSRTPFQALSQQA